MIMTFSLKKMHAVKTEGEEESPSTHALGGDFPMLVIVSVVNGRKGAISRRPGVRRVGLCLKTDDRYEESGNKFFVPHTNHNPTNKL